MIRRFTARRIAAALSTGFAAMMIAACAGTGGSSSATPGELIVYDGGGAWGEAQRKAYFEPFEKETGIKIVPAPAPLPAQVQTAIDAGNPGVDVYDLSGTDLGQWRQAGLLQPVDYSGWSADNKEAFSPYPTEPDAVPSLIFASQIAYDPAATGRPIDSWTQFFDQQIPGKRSLGDAGANISSGTIEAALLADGVPADQLYPLDVDRAFRKLDQIKPEILKYWQTGAESVQMLTDKQVSAVAAWNGRVSAAADSGASVSSTWNQAVLEVDYWVIPKGSPNAANASKFIEFVSRPDRQAEFASLITYSPTNSRAFDQIPPERAAVLPTAPDHVSQTVASDNDFWSSTAPSGKPWSAEIVDRWQTWLTKG